MRHGRGLGKLDSTSSHRRAMIRNMTNAPMAFMSLPEHPELAVGHGDEKKEAANAA